MALYQISYNLCNHTTMNQYEELIGELKRLGAKKVQLSEWFWRGDSTPEQFRDHLLKFVHQSDRLLVTTVSDWASWNALVSINEI
jgi:hypothetical protein